MPRILALGHVTWDRFQGRDVLGGTVSFAALTALKLGWEAAVLTSASPDFMPARDLPGISAFVHLAQRTTRFHNDYLPDGTRLQLLAGRADDVELTPLPDAWRDPDALLLGPLAGELGPRVAPAFSAGVVGAVAQGWLREFAPDGRVSPRAWRDPRGDLEGVHAVFLSVHDLGGDAARARDLLEHVPIVCLTRGWEGVDLITRASVLRVPSLPRREVDPTGAGDVFAAGFLVRYHETGDPEQAAAFACCTASCVVEGVGTSTLGDRAEVERRLLMRERLIEEGDWDE